LPPYTGYKSNVNPGAFQEFSHAMFRYGHSEVNNELLRLDANYQPLPGGPLLMKDAYFNPQPLEDEGMRPNIMFSNLKNFFQ
jgi:peroxidase